MPTFIPLLPLVLALPLAGVVLLVLFGGRIGGRASGWLATTMVGFAFLLSLAIAFEYEGLREAPASSGTEADHALDDEGSHSVEEHGASPEWPVIERKLWRWMRVNRSLPLVVAAEPLAVGDTIDETMLDIVDVPYTDALGILDLSISVHRMWSADQALGLVARDAIEVGEVLSDMNVSAGADQIRPLGIPEAVGDFSLDVGLRLDWLSVLMLLVITGVGFLIHIYSTGYMAHDPDRRRYFTYLNLFVFSMLVLVLGSSFLTLFVGWELVGACSYLLIGFWHRSEANASAGRKAFIVNRIGDLAFLVGMMLLWTHFGSLAFGDVLPRAAELTGLAAIAAPLLLLGGATGKSAQIPLYVWLPDAMAGPTPVSALIHAATMVTAGVYMIARVHPLFDNAPGAMAAVAVVGGATALIAALIALVQVDIKRVLAYSTVSQLGYMFMAVGSGAYVAGVFHLMTHAFFKALLFLGAGSLMHAMEHGAEHAGEHPEALDGIPYEQDMRHMGGLLRRAPRTGWTFLIGGLALAGVFPLAGFWSKDEILLEVLAHGGGLYTALYAVGLLTAFLTALYTGRQLLLVLFGEPRSEAAAQAGESPLSMTVPLIVLAVLSIVGGLPVLSALGAPFPERLGDVLGHHAVEGLDKIVLALIASAAALAGLGLAWWMYGRRVPDLGLMAGRAGAASRVLWGKLYVDEAYHILFVAPFVRIARVLWKFVDNGLVDGAVNGVGRSLLAAGQWSRRWQGGRVRGYGLSILLGAALMVAWLFVAAP